MLTAMTSPQNVSVRDVGFTLVGALVFVEIVSGFLQGYYTPLATDISRHLGINDADFNWFEASQLLVSALVVPVLSKLGDLYGHQRVLFWSALATAGATWGIAFAGDFTSYLIFWAVQGFFAVWLPLDVAIIYLRSTGMDFRTSATRKATGIIVAALQAGAITGALSAGITSAAFDELWMVLAVPAVLTTAVAGVIHVAISRDHVLQPGTIDGRGIAWLSAALIAMTGGLSLVRIMGVDSAWPWLAIVVGLALFLPFGRHSLRHRDPLVDLRVLRQPSMWPIQVTAGLFGISVLGAQIPLSTFAQTDPVEHGYGLGLNSSTVAPIIGGYVLSLLVGALLFARLSTRFGPRNTLIGATILVATGYGALVPFHDSIAMVVSCMVVAGLGSGALVAALPAAAAAAAPEGRVGVATGLTNTTKTVGGAVASCVFGVALASGTTSATAASMSGYYVVWIVCSVTALVAAVLLRFVPTLAFADPIEPEELLT